MSIPKSSKETSLRFLTFNVNAIRTFFHYDPFSSMNENLSKVFSYLDADIITFQELKTETSSIIKWGKLCDFYSFISIPTTKKGYAGVGCWVRKVEPTHPLYKVLHVTKAEEGITGYLTIKKQGRNGEKIRYRDLPSNDTIGGFENITFDDESEALSLDSEGRCVMVELACNIVVISVYCPANSSRTLEGELFRMKFLRVLFKRIENLHHLGKEVVLMGDVNVCRDLIDHAEALEVGGISIKNETTGIEIEAEYQESCRNFILNPDVPYRRLLNQMLTDSIVPELAQTGFLVDTTRMKQSRNRLKMYTVWNTLKNYRPVNYGSRVDYILMTSNLGKAVIEADILPSVNGSDHCPVFTDIDCTFLQVPDDIDYTLIPRFEARFKFDLLNHNILDMFAKRNNNPKRKPSVTLESTPSQKKIKPLKKSTPRSKTIESFFTSSIPQKKPYSDDASISSRTASSPVPSMHRSSESDVSSEADLLTSGNNKSQPSLCSSHKVSGRSSSIKDLFGKPPLCKHGEESILRTSKTSSNPGKRFWICKKPRGDLNNPDASCGFFQWL
ncbi:DNA-(apurinic or apyrimidinic site) lyase APN2 NDAI_0B02930 [Naumovozyma dairenensis CBS 421]|uniref:DNA-(apurinic or apyrimidinic site) endonuclease 2 n=1 Tax=Naumovozyma dairenensis (strain ATCC 10597 / BCRC 20456 / CBS 421 / NBRC 0211 / NRRL Y-12639) TaxID=1071378 RepID=G0W6B7_NAUDC|nr:hypothetical protein NDAI_0B02930 [Naumovozyma dairenensis CBS 421]CCD23328.1 hypothetical protein NDAI_0B02930 [Naumovozyma dairenensis CBS 421]